MIQYTIKNLNELQEFAAEVYASGKKIICLEGDLGAGKTEFARAFINHIAQKKITVSSPTYNIVQNYEFDGEKIFHFDLYRLECHSELVDIGFEEALNDGICLIEWPDIAQYELGLIPAKQKTTLKIEILDGKSRRITVV